MKRHSNDKTKPNKQKRRNQKKVEKKTDTSTSTPVQLNKGQVLPFPRGLSFPKDDFLRHEAPFQESFAAALETCYLGLAIDDPSTLARHIPVPLEQKKGNLDKFPLQETLEEMENRNFFQADITQPFGLGSKCAKTFVTRCLVGDTGTTYKYLGLRMFAYTWNSNSNQKNNDNDKLCQEIKRFKDDILVPRTKQHLKSLVHKRKQANANGHSNANDTDISRSRPDYNICLINRMDASNPQYKLEPSLQHDKIAVAWHADSILEHYSNIAVYQLITNNQNNQHIHKDSNGRQDWSLALRVVPNAEGPNIQADKITPDDSTPAVSLSLPSGSAYYMLDDFNHHHQHAVLRNSNQNESENENEIKSKKKARNNLKQQKPPQDSSPSSSSSSSSIRYSCTYRLLRPSHTVQEALEQCRKICAGFHKRGPKIWRSEQLCLTYIESEWLRQFYIQGQHHYDMLWHNNNWGPPLKQLWKYWAQLETRTQQTVQLLQWAAAQAQAQAQAQPNNNNAPTISRKQRDKQRKAFATVQELLARQSGTTTTNTNSNALQLLYEPLAELLRERATLRLQWQKREKDHVFTTVDPRYRPLPWPVQYENDSNSNNNHQVSTEIEIMASSPLPQDLRPVVDQLMAAGRTSYCYSDNQDSRQSSSGLAKPPVATTRDNDHDSMGGKAAGSEKSNRAMPTSGSQGHISKRNKKRNKTKNGKRNNDDASAPKKKKRRF
ncbi:fat mass and obesity associated [Seminavis robusta]|uniref:Alpha-ketoglutarate-dependent dioxygenase FTO n=1 Tax=Seminavis robusta TaxID=568900 RepID=A0A9N8D9E7_9STRA|nr:fat mass and obesity associated [Seminavis robusta]|eukprot:Sro23_g015600.1 fat mass and obesity associated (719) ;mRNA; r:24717-26873